MAINGPVTRGENIRPGIHKYFARTGKPSWSYQVQSDFGVERNGLWMTVLFLCDTVVCERGSYKRGASRGLFIFNSEISEELFQFDSVKGFGTVKRGRGLFGFDRQSFHSSGIWYGVCGFWLRFLQAGGWQCVLVFKPAEKRCFRSASNQKKRA